MKYSIDKSKEYGVTLYRGRVMSLQELEKHKEKMNKKDEDGKPELFCIQGFISTSLDLETA